MLALQFAHTGDVWFWELGGLIPNLPQEEKIPDNKHQVKKQT